MRCEVHLLLVEAATNFVLDRVCIPTYSSGKCSRSGIITWESSAMIWETRGASSEALVTEVLDTLVPGILGIVHVVYRNCGPSFADRHHRQLFEMHVTDSTQL